MKFNTMNFYIGPQSFTCKNIFLSRDLQNYSWCGEIKVSLVNKILMCCSLWEIMKVIQNFIEQVAKYELYMVNIEILFISHKNN